MKMHDFTLRLLLALVFTFASVASAAHIHIDSHSDEEHIEQCLHLHQLQYSEPSAPPSFVLEPAGQVQLRPSGIELGSIEQSRRPQVRAPPIAS